MRWVKREREREKEREGGGGGGGGNDSFLIWKVFFIGQFQAATAVIIAMLSH